MDDQMMQQVTLLVQAAMQGDKQAGLQILLIMLAALKGDKQSAILALAIQQVALLLLGGKPSARLGAKLNYLKSLQNQCPEGTELKFFKAGGKVCSKCEAKRKAAAKKACGGIKLEKGGISQTINEFKTAHKAKCGGKIKK